MPLRFSGLWAPPLSFAALLFLGLPTARAQMATPAGLALSQSFPAVPDDGVGVPPDPQGAAGPQYLLAMTNTRFTALRKDGSLAATWTPAQFWATVSLGDLLFDPRVMYDAASGRWIAVMVTAGSTAPPAVLLAVSAGADPTQGWSFQRIPADPTRENYAEFPLVGGNARWICITADLLSTTTGGLSGGAIWAIEKAPLFASNTLSASRFTVAGRGLPLTPAVTFDPDEPDEFLVGGWSGNDNGHGELQVLRLTDSGGQPFLSPAVLVAAPATWTDHSTPFDSLPQSGTSRGITSAQDDVASACLRHGVIWAVQTATIPAGAAPLHTAVQWWRITTAGAFSGFGRIEDPTGSTWLGYPSVAVNANDQVLVGYSLFSASTFASAGYSLLSSTGCDAELSRIRTLRAGDAPYVRPDASGLNRWGDLSQTVVDPTDDISLWTIQEYAAAPVNGQSRWATWWGKVSPNGGCGPGGPEPCPCVPDAATLCLNGGRFQVQAQWTDFQANTGSGDVVCGTSSDSSGLFWFFSPDNWEVLLKVLDGCGVNGNYWVFGAASTNVAYTITVTDTRTGAVRSYTNPLGSSSPAITDTAAFPACP